MATKKKNLTNEKKANNHTIKQIKSSLTNYVKLTYVCLVLILLYQQKSFALNTDSIANKKIKNLKIGTNSYKTISGTINVPLDYNVVNSKKITLPIYIIKSNNINPDVPVFFLEGGPGSSNIITTKNTKLLENHDFICVGYRGADGEIIFKSKKIAKAAKGVKNQLLSTQSIQNLKKTSFEYFNNIVNSGIDLKFFTILDVVDDINYAKNMLGYDKINILSVSYGTRVALLFDYKYPETIKRSIMIGANPPGHFIWFPKKTNEIIKIYDSLYFSQPYRFKGNGNITDAMDCAFKNMPNRWAGYKLDKDKIKIGVFLLMYQKDHAVVTFDALFKAAYKKDYSGLYGIQVLYNYFSSKNIWGDMFVKGYSADYISDFNYNDTLRKDSSCLLGPNYSLLLWASIPDNLKNIIPDYYRTLHNSDTETLIISGTLDVSTPSDYAKYELMPHLQNGKQLILNNMSHSDLIFSQVDNYRQVITDYFKTGNVNPSTFKEEKVNFKPKKNLNKLTKVLYPILFLFN